MMEEHLDPLNPAGFSPRVWRTPLQRLRRLVRHLHDERPHPSRKLHFDDLLLLLLFAFFNPVLTSLRALQRATGWPEVQQGLGVGRTSLGSLSEAAAWFDARKVYPLLRALARKARAAGAAPKIPGLPQGLTLIAQDASLWQALPSMAWALWLDPRHRGVKAHLQYDLSRGVPVHVEVSSAQKDERNALRQALQPNTLYVLDRGYRDFSLYAEILAAGSSFLARLTTATHYQVLQEQPLSDAASAAGVQQDAVVHLGRCSRRNPLSVPVRLLRVQRLLPASAALRPLRQRGKHKAPPAGEPSLQQLTLVTDRMDLSPESLVLLYQHRWQIEIFFRWLKSTLRCRRLLFHSQNGVTLQIYMALIATLLIVLWTGRKPTKALLEALHFYLMGWASWQDVQAHLAQLKKSS